MHTHNATLYPMLGVGAFMTMFWTGVVVGHELGLACVSLLIMGLLCACIACVGVCELQRRDRQGFAPETRGRAPGYGEAAGGAAAREPLRGAAGGSRPGPVTLGRHLPAGPF